MVSSTNWSPYFCRIQSKSDSNATEIWYKPTSLKQLDNFSRLTKCVKPLSGWTSILRSRPLWSPSSENPTEKTQGKRAVACILCNLRAEGRMSCAPAIVTAKKGSTRLQCKHNWKLQSSLSQNGCGNGYKYYKKTKLFFFIFFIFLKFFICINNIYICYFIIT